MQVETILRPKSIFEVFEVSIIVALEKSGPISKTPTQNA